MLRFTIFTRALLTFSDAGSSEILSSFNTFSVLPIVSALLAARMVSGGVVEVALCGLVKSALWPVQSTALLVESISMAGYVATKVGPT